MKDKSKQRKQSSNKQSEKLLKLQKSFTAKHTCSACKKPLTWIEGTNICVCKNPGCQGIQRTRTVETNEGSVEEVYYTNSYHVLDQNGTNIAELLSKIKISD